MSNMVETYFPLVRREPFLVGYWRQNDATGNPDAVDFASRFGLIGIYTGRTIGPPLIQDDTTSMSSLLAAASMVVPNVAPLQIIGDISIEAWIVAYSNAETANIVSKQNSGATVAAPYGLSLVNGKLTFSVGNGTTQTSIASTVSVNASIPTHVVATSFRGALAVYVNGAIAGTGSVGFQTVVDGAQGMVAGVTGTQPGIELLSELAVYNGALSARRVARHFAVGQQVFPDPAHYLSVDPPSAA